MAEQKRSIFSLEVRRVYVNRDTGQFSDKSCLGYDQTYIFQLVPRKGKNPNNNGRLVYGLCVSTTSRAAARRYIDENITPVHQALCNGEISEKEARVRFRELGSCLNIDTVLLRGNLQRKRPVLEYLFDTPVAHNLGLV